MEIKEVSTLVPIYILDEHEKKLAFMDAEGIVYLTTSNLIPLNPKESEEITSKFKAGLKIYGSR